MVAEASPLTQAEFADGTTSSQKGMSTPSCRTCRVKRNADFATTKLRPAQVNVGELDPTGQRQQSP
jgi:hypothetical protein